MERAGISRKEVSFKIWAKNVATKLHQIKKVDKYLIGELGKSSYN